MKDYILIVGGYGKVGSIISRQLAQVFPNKVMVAGRDVKKAQQLAQELNHQVIPYSLDISDADPTVLNNTKLVVMCIDQNDTKFVELCIEKGIHYIDITANQHFLEQVELLNQKANKNNVTVALSIGLAPGITNLLAQHAANRLSEVALIDIFILLGLGEKHGDAAYRWTFDNIHSEYQINHNGITKTIKSFTRPKRTSLLGQRTFYTFNFSDQHTLSKTMITKSVLTRMAFDSRFMTAFVAFLRKLGLTNIFNSSKIQSIFIRLFKMFDVGTDDFAVKVVAENNENKTYKCQLSGKGEGNTTAYVTVEAALHVINNNTPHGVMHLHEIIKHIPDFLESLKQYDNSIKIQYD